MTTIADIDGTKLQELAEEARDIYRDFDRAGYDLENGDCGEFAEAVVTKLRDEAKSHNIEIGVAMFVEEFEDIQFLEQIVTGDRLCDNVGPSHVLVSLRDQNGTTVSVDGHDMILDLDASAHPNRNDIFTGFVQFDDNAASALVCCTSEIGAGTYCDLIDARNADELPDADENF